MAMTDPDGYERAITLVGMVANELRQQCGDLESVLERRNERSPHYPNWRTRKGSSSVDCRQMQLSTRPPPCAIASCKPALDRCGCARVP